jgi:putative membrane protein insertion efficiency factor
MSQLLSILIRLYRLTLGTVLPNACRYHPSCSAYALEALATHGAFRGSLLAARRLLRCSPLFSGGYDPVPPHRQSETVDCRCRRSTP